MTGDLHRAERELAGYAEADYPASLRRCLERAAGVWVVNPAIAESVKPHAQQVEVIPSGFDPARFADPITPLSRTDGRLRIFFAGLIQEPMKGFAVLQAACARLWEERRDFRLQATGDPSGPMDEFTEFVGWQSQADLPRCMGAADIVVCPTIAEEALGRTAVEAMGLGRPVVASRIGGLPFTVLEDATGLLATPGDSADLARQLARLLDDEPLRRRLGAAGRARFESHYTWPVIVERHYRRILGPPLRPVREGAVP
jgi:glycosyltransferase involved in cell wall biosynthesis